MARVTLHLPRHMIDAGTADPRNFYGKLQASLIQEGHDVGFRRRISVYSGPGYSDDGLHIVHQGLVRQCNALNTAIAYLNPF